MPETEDWYIVKSAAGNYHLTPNVWANDTIIKELGEMTQEEAKEEYKAYQEEITPKFCW